MALVNRTQIPSTDPTPTTQRTRSNGLLFIAGHAVVLIGAAILRFHDLAKKPFWFDECFSVEAARLDWSNFAHLLWWREANMSLYYLLLRGWLHLGHSEFFIRSLSAVLSLATLPAIYWLGKLLFDRRAGLLAAVLLAVNAYHIRYAQEARSYVLFVLLATLSSAFLVAFLRSPSSGNRVGYVLTSALAAYAHFYALLLLVGHWLATRVLRRANAGNVGEGSNSSPTLPPELRRAWLWIGVAVLPLLVFVGKLGAGPIKWIQRPGLHDVFDYYQNMSGNAGLLGVVIYFAACSYALAPSGKRLFQSGAGSSWDIWRYQFLLIWILFPVVLTILLSFARPVFYARYLLFCLPAFLVLAAAGLARLHTKWLVGLVLAVTLALSLRGTVSYYEHDFDLERDGIGAASNFVLDNAQSGDAVLFHIAATRVAYEFYRSQRDVAGPIVLFPHHSDRLAYQDFTGKPSIELLESIPLQHRRVWLVLMYNSTPAGADPTSILINKVLSPSFSTRQHWTFPKAEVSLYSR